MPKLEPDRQKSLLVLQRNLTLQRNLITHKNLILQANLALQIKVHPMTTALPKKLMMELLMIVIIHKIITHIIITLAMHLTTTEIIPTSFEEVFILAGEIDFFTDLSILDLLPVLS